MQGHSPIIDPWMIGALNRYGNTMIGEAKMNRHGKQAYIEAFASCGFDVEIKESPHTEGYICQIKGREGSTTSLRATKMKSFIVSLKSRKENKDDQ